MTSPTPAGPLDIMGRDEARAAEGGFRRLFAAASAPLLVVATDAPHFTITEVNDAYLAATLRTREELIGRALFDAFPDNPQLAHADGVANLRTSLERALASGRPDAMPLQRYDIARRDGRFEERWWEVVNTPVLGPGGRVEAIVHHVQDVTARRRAEDRLRSVFAIQTVGVMYWGEGFGLTDMNDAFLRMTGFTREEALGKTWAELTPPEFHPASLRAVREVTTRGETTPYEKQYYRKDGSRWWGLFAARKVDDEVVEFVLDVTERREAEAALREQQEQLRLIVDGATDYAIMTLDLDRRVTSWSPGAARTFGYAADEIVGRSGDRLFTPEDREAEQPRREADTAVDAGCAADVRWHLRKDGSRVFVDGSNRPLHDAEGRHIGFLKIARDETERQRAQEALRRSEAQFRTLAEAIPAMVFLVGREGNIYTNRQYQTYTGRTAEALAGLGWRSAVHPDDLAAVDAGLGNMGGRREFEVELRVRGSDGAYRWFLCRSAAVDDGADGVRAVGTCIDIEDRKRAEAELRRLNETLETRVIEEVAARFSTEEALRQAQKMEAIGQLTGGVAHDFNNLLTVIRSSADLLRRHELTEEKRRRYVDAISDTADRAAKLTGQLLAFARRQALKPEVFDAGARVRAIADMLRTVVGSRIELVVDAGDADCFVEADAGQFETALVNMAVNARDAMEGQGRLTIAIGPATNIPRVRGHGPAAGAFVAVTVADTGHGIAPDRIPHIFEPFFTTKEVGKGTGLGLSQVYGFAKQSGGEVAVDSRVGEGTTFTMYLPRVDAPAAASAANDAAPSVPTRRGHVLIAEDNEQVGSFSTQLLAELGFETTWAGNADAALRLLEENAGRYQAVFSDVVMPGMSGVDLGHEIRRRWPGLPVVLTSGYSHVLAQEGRHGFELLQKPYSVEDLTRVIGQAIQRTAA